MIATDVQLRDFRSYERAEVALGAAVSVVHGPNGAGKTNLLEAIYFGCTGRSCRTGNEREVVRFGAPATRVQITVDGADGTHRLSVGFAPGEPKRMQVDGAPVERLSDSPHRPLVSVFMPDRLELIKGAPGLRRAHIDQVIAALWPARAQTRRSYAQALAQRNALLAAIRAGRAGPASLATWDGELARHAIPLRDDRARAAGLLAPHFERLAEALGIAGAAELRYRPRSEAASAEAFVAELQARRSRELERGFGAHGPHRDDLVFARDGRELRAFGSQGEQRLALLALLLAERSLLAGERGESPLMLLDDVMSELDGDRRRLLAQELSGGGQSVITTTEAEHVPPPIGAAPTLIAVAPGSQLASPAPA